MAILFHPLSISFGLHPREKGEVRKRNEMKNEAFPFHLFSILNARCKANTKLCHDVTWTYMADFSVDSAACI
jgi:hypothetical protein